MFVRLIGDLALKVGYCSVQVINFSISGKLSEVNSILF